MFFSKLGKCLKPTRSIFLNPKNPDPSKLAVCRAPTPAIQAQTLPLQGPCGFLGNIDIFTQKN